MRRDRPTLFAALPPRRLEIDVLCLSNVPHVDLRFAEQVSEQDGRSDWHWTGHGVSFPADQLDLVIAKLQRLRDQLVGSCTIPRPGASA